MLENTDNERKEIEIVKGDGENLEISKVFEHLNAVKQKPKDEKKKEIVVPEIKIKKD